MQLDKELQFKRLFYFLNVTACTLLAILPKPVKMAGL